MKIQTINYNIREKTSFAGIRALQETFANKMSKFTELGEAANISFDFLGKALVVPAVIMAASDEPKEKKSYSAMKNTVAATIQLALEVPILYFGSMYIAKLANQGKLDKAGSDFSYNEKLARDVFTKTMKEKVENAPQAEELLNRLNAKGFNKKLGEELEQFVQGQNSAGLKNSLESLQTTHKRLYHLQNRVCFGAALLLTPIICALEDWSHPKVMDQLYNDESKYNTIRKSQQYNMKSFLQEVKAGKNAIK